MPIVKILPSAKTIDVPEGTSLLAAVQKAGEKITTDCGGQADCGQCHIYVQEGRKGVSKMKAAENSLLDTIVGVSSKSRLACQTLVGTTDVTVELLGFASGV